MNKVLTDAQIICRCSCSQEFRYVLVPHMESLRLLSSTPLTLATLKSVLKLLRFSASTSFDKPNLP